MKQHVQNTVALLARQTARLAERDIALNDLADALYVFCVQIGVPREALPK